MNTESAFSSCFFCDPSPEYVCHAFDNFKVHIDPYPLCEKHVLVSSKEHYGCAGELPDDLREELLHIDKLLREVLSSFSDSWIVYEHGRSGTCQSSPEAVSCYHLHLHFLPLSLSIHEELRAMFQHQPVQGFTDLRKWFHGYGEYLYFEDQEHSAECYFSHGKAVPPHLLRTLIAEKLGRPDLSDWEHYRDRKLFQTNCEFKKVVSSMLQSCYV